MSEVSCCNVYENLIKALLRIIGHEGVIHIYCDVMPALFFYFYFPSLKCSFFCLPFPDCTTINPIGYGGPPRQSFSFCKASTDTSRLFATETNKDIIILLVFTRALRLFHSLSLSVQISNEDVALKMSDGVRWMWPELTKTGNWLQKLEKPLPSISSIRNRKCQNLASWKMVKVAMHTVVCFTQALQETPLSEWYVHCNQSHWDSYRDGVWTTAKIDKTFSCFLENATSRHHFLVSIKTANLIPHASLFMTADMIWQEPDKGYNSQAIMKASISLIPWWLNMNARHSYEILYLLAARYPVQGEQIMTHWL